MFSVDDITFWGVNIPKELENVMNKANKEIIESFEDEEQYKAYLLGVNNTIFVLKQLLNQGLNKDSITFYYPECNTEEEMSFDEVADWAHKLD